MNKLITAIFILFVFASISLGQDNSTLPTTPGSLEVCTVSGEALNPGQAIEFAYLGTNYKFCCEGCLAKFKKEPMDYIKGEVMCPVMGEAASREYPVVYNGVTYYMCCAPCIKKFNKTPEDYIKGEKKENHN